MWLSALEKINSLIGILGTINEELPPLIKEPDTTPDQSILRGFRGHENPFYFFLILVILILLIVLWHRHPID